jgi:hypothetical protein
VLDLRPATTVLTLSGTKPRLRVRGRVIVMASSVATVAFAAMSDVSLVLTVSVVRSHDVVSVLFHVVPPSLVDVGSGARRVSSTVARSVWRVAVASIRGSARRAVPAAVASVSRRAGVGPEIVLRGGARRSRITTAAGRPLAEDFVFCHGIAHRAANFVADFVSDYASDVVSNDASKVFCDFAHVLGAGFLAVCGIAATRGQRRSARMRGSTGAHVLVAVCHRVTWLSVIEGLLEHWWLGLREDMRSWLEGVFLSEILRWRRHGCLGSIFLEWLLLLLRLMMLLFVLMLRWHWNSTWRRMIRKRAGHVVHVIHGIAIMGLIRPIVLLGS